MKFNLQNDVVQTKLDYGELNISSDEEKGFRPFQLMVSSVAGCSASVLNKILGKQRIELENLQVEAEVTRNEDEANRIEKIKLHFILTGKDLDEKKMSRNMELARKNCSMVRSVESSIDIEETMELKEA